MQEQPRETHAPPLSMPGDKEHELLSALLEVAGALVVVLDPQGRIMLFNQACEQLTGRRQEQVLGRRVWDLFLAPEERAPVQDYFQQLTAGDFPSENENYWQTDTNERRWIHWKNTALTDREGGVQYVVATGIDITERRRMEQALQEAYRYNEAILETAVDGIVCIDEAGRITIFNRAAERIFGYQASEVLGSSIDTLMPDDLGNSHNGYIHRYLTTAEPRIIGFTREVTGRRRDGTAFPLELSVGEVPLSGRRMFTGIVRDISERRQAEQEAKRRMDELAQVSRLSLMGEMAAGLAHEINQPLSAIVNYAQACRRLLQTGQDNTQLLLDSLTSIVRQGERAGEIVSHLRQFIDRGKTERAATDINGIVREVVELLRHEIEVHDVALELDLDPRLPALSIDKVQIEQVILNLIKNAVDAMKAADRVRRLQVRSRRAPAAAEVSVSDTGVGLPDGSAARVFEPLYTTKPNGLGVGLSISRSIVRTHGGRLWATPNPGPGASFHFTLPAAGNDAADS